MSDKKLQTLQNLTEAEFRESVLLHLLPKMGAKQVRHSHGAYEHGKDITFFIESDFGRNYHAIIAKVGDISGASSGSRNLTNLLNNINNQIIEAFDIRINDVTNTNSERVRINHVIVWTTGNISKKAEEQILENLQQKYQNVAFYDGQKTVELLDEYFPSFFSIGDADVANYFDGVKDKYSKLEELTAFGSLGSSKMLPAVFIEPQLEVMSRLRNKHNTRQDISKTISFRRLVDLKSNAVIIGDMGSGKSTLLRRIALETISKNEKAITTHPIPILLRFKSLNIQDTNPLDVQSERVIEDALEAEYNSLCKGESKFDITSDLNNGHILILIDALDELETEANVKLGMGIVRAFSKKYPKSRIVITTRIMELFKTSNFFNGFRVYQINELSRKQITNLIYNWFGKDSEDSKRLISLVSKPMTMIAIPATPLALAIVAVLYENGHRDIPSNLTELFKKYTELALGRWDIGKSIKSQVDYSYKELVLRRVSWQMADTYTFNTTLGQLIDSSECVKNERALSYDAQLLVNETIERSGLFIRNGENKYEFKHRAFMDYFAGSEINSMPNSIEQIIDRFGDPIWTMPIFFASGLRSESGEYLRAIIDSPDKMLDDHFFYAMQLGYMAQAAYLARRDIKLAAVKQSLVAFVEGWNDLVQDLNVENLDGSLTHLPHLMVLLLYSSVVRSSIGSSTLAASLSELVDYGLNNVINVDELPVHEQMKHELYLHSLAISCANAENVEGFIKLFESDLIKDPAYAIVGHVECKLLLQQDLLADEYKERISKLEKRLKRKISNNRKYLDDLMNQPPMLIGVSSENLY